MTIKITTLYKEEDEMYGRLLEAIHNVLKCHKNINPVKDSLEDVENPEFIHITITSYKKADFKDLLKAKIFTISEYEKAAKYFLNREK